MKRFALVAAAAMLAVLTVLPAAAERPPRNVIPLPDGFRPEGIAARGNRLYAGSIPTGQIVEIRNGRWQTLVPAQQGRAAIGLSVRGNQLWVAGGGTGDAYVYDVHNGDELAVYNFTDSSDTFINDQAVTSSGAWFTDSRQPVLYHVPISPNGTPSASFETLELTGDLVVTPGVNNLNGIVATGSGLLIAVQSNTGLLFTIDPESGETDLIELAGGESVPNGDGMYIEGRTLYVVQNRLNVVAKIALSADYGSGVVQGRFGDPSFDVPTTIARAQNSFFLVNARFTTTPTPSTEYWITETRIR